MNTLLTSLKNNKLILTLTLIGLALVAAGTAHAAGCAGPFNVVMDVNGHYFHQHYAINNWGHAVLTYWHY